MLAVGEGGLKAFQSFISNILLLINIVIIKYNNYYCYENQIDTLG